MIETIDNLWIDSTYVNNTSYRLISVGTQTAIVIEDFLKYPDKLKDIIEKFPYYNSQPTWRPGKTFGFPSSHSPKFGSFISNKFSEIFDNSQVECYDMYVNCFNGQMNCSYNLPHVDCSIVPLSIQTHLAVNLCLTKNMFGGTSLWSYKNKMSLFEMSLTQINELYHIMNSFNRNNNVLWSKFDGDVNFKLEDIIPMQYNTLIAYSTTVLHSPHIETNWFNDHDRLTLAAFLQIYPNVTKKNKNMLDKFNLSQIFNLTF